LAAKWNCLSLQPDLKQTPRQKGQVKREKENKESGEADKFFVDGKQIRE
jgi:hypothetical protein